MTDRLITHLRHVDLAVPDHDKQLDFFTGAWGLKAEHTDTGLTFLAAEGSPEQYIIRLRQAADKRIDLIAFGAASAADVDTLAGRLSAAGVQLVSEPGTVQTPGGGYGFRFFDHEGRTVEISSDVAVRAHRKIEEGESIPVRLSHVVINSADPEATWAFYERHLGFALSDTLMHPRMGEMMWFMRINSWHHSLAIARCPHPSLHHASFDEFIPFAGQVNLDGVVEKITVPFLIAHGAGDRQILLEYAHRSYDQAVASPKRELRVFTAEEGATEHIGLDHLPYVSTFIADWVADTFAELNASRR